MVSERDTRPDYGKQLMRGMMLAGALMALAKGLGPQIATLGTESAQWVMLALFCGIVYGLFVSVTSPAAIELYEWAERTLTQNANAD